MEREIRIQDLERLYDREDLAELGTGGCRGCSHCCRNTGRSILLDPYDIRMLTTERGVTWEELKERLEFHVVDGMILPNLRMGSGGCSFLDGEGRCSIHAWRPGFCRMFPLARIYQGEHFRYFLQGDQCPQLSGERIRIRDWIGVPEMERYEDFVAAWHCFLREISAQVPRLTMRTQRMMASYLLKRFYETPYSADRDFYSEFEERMLLAENAFRRLPRKEA